MHPIKDLEEKWSFFLLLVEKKTTPFKASLLKKKIKITKILKILPNACQNCVYSAGDVSKSLVDLGFEKNTPELTFD